MGRVKPISPTSAGGHHPAHGGPRQTEEVGEERVGSSSWHLHLLLLSGAAAPGPQAFRPRLGVRPSVPLVPRPLDLE